MLAATSVSPLVDGNAFAQSQKIRIGYAVSMTGVFAGSAAMQSVANYRLWVKMVNDHGGLKVAGRDKPVLIEAIEYDDTSNPENAIRLTERLMSDDKVDFVLPPWGQGMNVAVAPVYKRYAYPQLCTTATVADGVALTKRFDSLFLFHPNSGDYAGGLASLLSRLRSDGKINDKVAVLSVADQFGADMNVAADKALNAAGFKIVVGKSYPMVSRDLSAELKQAQESGADSFLAFSYPPDTFLLAGQAQILGYNPKLFYSGVGSAFGSYRDRMGGKAEGLLGIGGWDQSSPDAKTYFDAFKLLTGNETDRWGSPVSFASLQTLQQAIERVGLERPKVIQELRTGKFETIVGRFGFQDQVRTSQPLVSQWQGGEFVVVAPDTFSNVKPLLFPKPSW